MGAFGWKLLVPLSFINIVVTGVVLFYEWPLWSLSLISLVLLAGTFYIIFKRPGMKMKRMTVTVHPAIAARTVTPATSGTPGTE